MKAVAILLLAAFVLNGCGSGNAVSTSSNDIWGAVMAGGAHTSSGFSFNTEFTVASDGTLTVSSFQFLNSGTCFGSSTITKEPTGKLLVTFNSDDQVTGTFSFTITSSAGDAITLTGTSVTGTVNPNNNFILSGGSIIGTWALVPGSSSSCVAVTDGSFTMTQTTT
jgi:hypothetical protein